jgi:hypothetical protein
MDPLIWQADLLSQLDNSGPDAQAAAAFIRERRIRVGFRKARPWVGAFWFVDGNIYLNATRYSPDTGVTNPRVLCLVVHEAHHLKQGTLTALSVYGELEAWQVDFGLYSSLTNRVPSGSRGAAIATIVMGSVGAPTSPPPDAGVRRHGVPRRSSAPIPGAQGNRLVAGAQDAGISSTLRYQQSPGPGG